MRRPLTTLPWIAALVLAIGTSWAGSSLVLTDGQVVKGEDVQREGDNYLVTMKGGGTVAVPAALVAEVKLEDDAPPANPNYGIYNTEPKTLAGPGPSTYHSQDPKDQLAVFGPPTRWSKSAVDTTVVLEDAWDRSKDVLADSRSTWSNNAVDTSWQPKEAFDTSKDVLAPSRSTWSKSAVDTTWQPTDSWGFKPLSTKGSTAKATYPMTFLPSGTPSTGTASSSSYGINPWSCGERLVSRDPSAATPDKATRATSVDVHQLKNTQFASLGIPLYVAEAKVGTSPRRAVFTVAGGECRLVGGDTDAIRGLNLSPEMAMAQDTAALNAALAASHRGIPAGVDKLDYAFAFVSLADASVSGSGRAKMTLVSTPEEMRDIAAGKPASCTLAGGKKRKEAKNASSGFAVPKIVSGVDGDVVTFLTWSSAGGTVRANTVVLGRDGAISAQQKVVATHVGAHADATAASTAAVTAKR